MKLTLKSIQDYKTHKEEYKEEFECKVAKTKNQMKIEFQDGYIIIEENKVIRRTKDNEIIIEIGKNTEIDYDTPNGIIVLDIFGLEMEKDFENTKCVAKIKYEIKIVGVEPYTNELQISLT